MRYTMILLGGLLVVLGVIGNLYVRVRMKPPADLDDYYHEFEDQHPGYQRYTRWLQWTLGAASLGVLLLFLAWSV